MVPDENTARSDGPAPREGAFGHAAVRGSFLNSLQWLVNKMLTAASMLLLARWLAPEDFGVATQTSAIVQFMAFCLPLALGDVVLARASALDAVGVTARALAIRAGVLNAALIVASIPIFLWVYQGFDPRVLGGLIGVLALRPVLEALQMLPLTQLRLRLAYGSIAKVEGVSQAASSLASLGMAAVGAGSAALVVPGLLGGGLRAWWFRRRAGAIGPGRPDREIARRLVIDYLPAAAAQYLHKVASTIEVLVLGYVCGELQTGLFAFAAMLAAQANTVIAYQLGLVLQPIFGRLQSDVTRQSEGFLRVLRVLGLFTVPIALTQVVVAEPLFRALFTDRYQSAVPAFQVISLTQAVLFAIGPTMAFLRSRGAFRLLLVWQIAQLSIGVPACWIGARIAGSTGAAIGSGAVWVLAVPAMTWLCIRGIRPRSVACVIWIFFKPMLANLPVFVIAHIFLRGTEWSGRWVQLAATCIVASTALATALGIACLVNADVRTLSRGLATRLGARAGRSR